jgi:toxin CptA
MHTPIQTFVISPSRWLRRGLIALHLLAMAAISLADLPLWLQLPLIALVAANLALTALPTQAQWHHLSIPFGKWQSGSTELRTEQDGTLLRKTGDEWQPASLLPSTRVTPWLTVLHLRDDNDRRTHIVILPDSLGQDDYRRLRVWLRWKATVVETDELGLLGKKRKAQSAPS